MQCVGCSAADGWFEESVVILNITSSPAHWDRAGISEPIATPQVQFLCGFQTKGTGCLCSNGHTIGGDSVKTICLACMFCWLRRWNAEQWILQDSSQCGVLSDILFCFWQMQILKSSLTGQIQTTFLNLTEERCELWLQSSRAVLFVCDWLFWLHLCLMLLTCVTIDLLSRLSCKFLLPRPAVSLVLFEPCDLVVVGDRF